MADEPTTEAPDDAREDAHERAGGDEDGRHGVPRTTSGGQAVLHPAPDELLAVVEALGEEGYTVCLDVTAVDYLTAPARDLPDGVDAERFELVVTLISHAARERIRLRVQVPAATPEVPSLFSLHPGTEAMEREVYDMFGITFAGHPDPTRILMPEDWEGHPLRKDYAVGAIPVQFKAAGSEER